MRDKRDDLFHYQDMSLEELYRKQRPDMDRFVVFDRYKPLLTTAALLFTGILLGTVLWVGYPDGDSVSDGPVPVIQADAGSYRVSPDDPGGMEVPHRDSVIFETMQTAGDFSDLSPSSGVENLLDEPEVEERLVEQPIEQPVEQLIDKDTYFSTLEEAKESANKYRATASPASSGSLIESLSIENEAPPREETVTEITAPINDITETVRVSLPKKTKVKVITPDVVATPVPGVKPQRPIAFKMKGVKESRDVVDIAASSISSIPSSSSSSVASRKTKANAETIDFVRSVLDQKITPPPSSVAAAAIQPSSGYTAHEGIVRAAPVATTATHYIQLGSLTSDAQARTHWATLQRQFPSQLSSLSMRVQQADLGARGMFYRVQAGPVSAGQAHDLCDSIKARKPGGCLVVGP